MNSKTFKTLSLALVALLCLPLQAQSVKDYVITQDGLLRTPVPQRPAGQKHVLALRTTPLKKVRVGYIGLGMRGPGAVYRMMHIPGVEVVALCDIEKDRVQKTNEILQKAGLPKAKEFYGDTSVWRKLTAMPNLDLVYICTDWKTHAGMAIQAMNDGKHVAIEVPAAMTMDEIWGLINTAERTQKHCMQLENCVYDFFELTSLNMAQQGLFGDIIHGEGAYIHSLDPFWKAYHNNWRLDYNRYHRGDVYPTHGLGPVCQAMNIHRGDRLKYLVCMDTKPTHLPKLIKENTGEEVKDFRNGDHTMTMIRTENGKSILIEHNVTTPRPYNRMFQLTGTKGFANKYPSPGFALSANELDAEMKKDHEDLSGHEFVPKEVYLQLVKKYRHPIVDEELEQMAKKVGGHGGMDFIMDYRLIYCLQHGLPLDMDVYDLAEWCCLVPLTELSVDHNSAPVEIPDFTRGYWKQLPKLEFAR